MSKLDDQIKMALILTAGGFIVGGGIGLLASVGAGALVGAGLIEGSKPFNFNDLMHQLTCKHHSNALSFFV